MVTAEDRIRTFCDAMFRRRLICPIKLVNLVPDRIFLRFVEGLV